VVSEQLQRYCEAVWPDLRAALSELAKTSLISWSGSGGEISIHPVFQTVTRQGLSKEERMASLESAWARIEVSLPNPEWNETGWRLWERLAPHVRVLLGHVEGTSIEVAAASTMNRYGAWLHNGSRRTFIEMINLDIFYIKNMSLRLDLQIMLRALPALLKALARKS
jgi:hypothetical protein